MCVMIYLDWAKRDIAISKQEAWEARMMSRLKRWARLIKRDIHALYLAARDPHVPWFAKALALVVAAYAVSPVDLIPDFIPIIGYLDDIIIVPLGIYLVVKLIPPDVMADHRKRAEMEPTRPTSKVAAMFIICIWFVSIGYAGWLIYSYKLME